MKNISEKIRKLNCIMSETESLYHKLNLSLGLSDSVSDILYLLYDNEGQYSISNLCNELSIPKQTINSALRNLEKEGIVFVEIYSGKNKRVVLTEKGWKHSQMTVSKIYEIEKAIFKEFSIDEIDAFLEFHKKYNVALNKNIDEKTRVDNERK